MRFAAAATATGVVGFLLLEALKILLAPAALWVLGMAMMVVKVVALGFVVAFRRWSRDSSEILA